MLSPLCFVCFLGDDFVYHMIFNAFHKTTDPINLIGFNHMPLIASDFLQLLKLFLILELV